MFRNKQFEFKIKMVKGQFIWWCRLVAVVMIMWEVNGVRAAECVTKMHGRFEDRKRYETEGAFSGMCRCSHGRSP